MYRCVRFNPTVFGPGTDLAVDAYTFQQKKLLTKCDASQEAPNEKRLKYTTRDTEKEENERKGLEVREGVGRELKGRGIWRGENWSLKLLQIC